MQIVFLLAATFVMLALGWSSFRAAGKRRSLYMALSWVAILAVLAFLLQLLQWD